MTLDSKQLAQAAADLKRDVLEKIYDDRSGPAYTLAMTRILLESPWVPDFLMPVITPLRGNLRSYLKMSVTRVDGRIWYFPSFHWWRNHARVLHGPDGSGCNLPAHVAHLTGSDISFYLQGNLLKDGSLRVLGEADFKLEEAFWKENQARFTVLPDADKNRELKGPERSVGQPNVG